GTTFGVYARRVAVAEGSSCTSSGAVSTATTDLQQGSTAAGSATLFAQDVMGWDPSKVHVQQQLPGGQWVLVDVWNTDMTSSFTADTATELTLQQENGEWIVINTTSALFDQLSPSNREDVIPTPP